jgi:hypothetical protein
VLTELRMSWQCGGAIHVTVVAYDNYRVMQLAREGSPPPGSRYLSRKSNQIALGADSPVRIRYAQARSRSHGGLPSRRLYARRR